jgi:Beta-propeller repeat
MIPVSKRIIQIFCVFCTVLLLLICSLPVNSCKKNKEIQPPSIASFSPTNGSEGTVVIITGNLIWVKSAGSNNDYDNAHSVATDALGNVYITGYFSRIATFGDKTLISNNISEDVFIAKYNLDGNILWVKQAGGSDTDQGNSIAVNAAGTITICGLFRGTGTSTFGATPVIGNGNDDIFLWRIWQ